MPTYTIFAGVNGAGKSTLYSTLLQENHDFGVRVNSDEIVISNGGDWRNQSDQAKAMKMAVKLIKDCMNKGVSFNQETTLTGRSMINNILKAKKLGYKIIMNYVGLNSPESAIQRVAHRVSMGGHGIPEEDIKRRYYVSLSKLKELMSFIDELYIYDNSKHTKLVAKSIAGYGTLLDTDCLWLNSLHLFDRYTNEFML
nr:zeta toxin family protein [uncultured Lachnoanaerobaculum sp.]